ncbi:hypothetical protein GCM10010178_13150 [Lentzea flava]|uniref:Variable large protein n=1 Tax=Lentzea flava TaxID=103732 RepID=A0ABQ2UE88_9PSEU|nr:hypothetical protein GCM10010178_13150 [Lentzea flava]
MEPLLCIIAYGVRDEGARKVMAEDAGEGTSTGVGKSISFVAETISKTAADVAGTLWNQ